MGRPKLYDEPRIATAVRLPASLHEQLLRSASARDVSVNFLVTRAVADYLGHLVPFEEHGGERRSAAPRRSRGAARSAS